MGLLRRPRTGGTIAVVIIVGCLAEARLLARPLCVFGGRSPPIAIQLDFTEISSGAEMRQQVLGSFLPAEGRDGFCNRVGDFVFPALILFIFLSLLPFLFCIHLAGET